METTKKSLFKDLTFLIGIVLLVLSMGIFLLPDYIHVEEEGSFLGIFFLNYFIAIAYLIIVSVREIGKFRISCFREKMEYMFLVLILFLISAYSLNREMIVFQLSTLWVQVFLTIQGVILLMSFLQHRFSAWIRFIYWICLGVILMFYLYLSLYLIPIYPISLFAFPFLGISLHALVPIGFITAILLYLTRKDQRKTLHFSGFGTGIILSIAAVLIFMHQWKNISQVIVRASDKSLIDEKNDLPEWAVVAQRMPLNQVSEKLLKTGLVYSQSETDHWTFFEMPSRNFDEERKHDPFVMLATFFFGAPDLSTEHKIKILEAMYDSRHKTQERLWSGRNLETTHVITNARIYPNLHIAYTEKIITIRNTRLKGTWNREEEAIYTFHLPEGSVVTSLSLWINGREEKGILTSKQKADTAYRTIVGIQRCDPSLIRWQEGNTVSVRIYPCSPDEDRRFKIGITSPLQSRPNRMQYENIWFEGPACSQTDETVQIRTMDPVELTFPSRFEEKTTDSWVYEGKYRPVWQIEMPQVAVKANSFHFDGKSYRISSYEKSHTDFKPGNIYLDINKAWTLEEFNLIRSKVISPKIYVYQNRFIELTDQNARKLFNQLTQLNFSLFPFYEIQDAENALIITKGSAASCNVSDLGESDFAKKLKAFASDHRHLKLYNLNDTLSPYLKTLKELRVFDFDSGSATDLIDLLNKHQYTINPEDSQNIIIHDAAVRITEKQDTVTLSNAPDHVMRLFTYNQVMFRTGTRYFDPDFNDSTIVNDAHKAYVVSPVSSLVVLETAQDYKRFNITDDGTSLKNASMKSSGAVPEPHEWLLIILTAGSVVYVLYKKKKIKFKSIG